MKRLNIFQQIGVVAACLLLSIGLILPVHAAPASSDVHPIFKTVMSKLADVKVPLRLPSYIPVDSEFPKAPDSPSLPIYANVMVSQEDSYFIVLGYSETCKGGNACRHGMVSGERMNAFAPDLNVALLDVQNLYNRSPRKSKDKPAMVQLSNGVQAVFEPWICFNTCTDAAITWDEGDYRYSIGVKVATKAGVLQMANSAITGK